MSKNMKFIKILLAFYLCLISGALFAYSNATIHCIEKLTRGFQYDSVNFFVDADAIEYTENDEIDTLAYATKIVRYVLTDNGCKKDDVNFSRTPMGRTSSSNCKQMAPDLVSSNVCYIESNLGYFFVNWDMLSNAHVTYSRWD